jgi:hypothetical protein
MRTRRWSEGRFRVEDAWTDRLVLSVPLAQALPWPRISVDVNGVRQDLRPARLRGGWLELSPVQFPFHEQAVERLRVYRGSGSLRTECAEVGDVTRMLFEHDPKAVHQNVQRRAALKEGPGIQLVCALQAYLWAGSPEGARALGSELEQLRARSVALCSSIYRVIPQGQRVPPEDVALREQRAEELTRGLDVSSPAARWYPSVKLAIAQLKLVTGDVEGCVEHLIDIADRQEAILEAEPLCAFNIALGCCLLSGILDARGDPRLERYGRRWEQVFRFYPSRLSLRFGTMEEFGKIYEACMLNYKLELGRAGCRDARFEPTSLEEILQTCLRVRVGGRVLRETSAAIGGQAQPPARKRRGLAAPFARLLGRRR